MFKKQLYYIGDGALCGAAVADGNVVITVREYGRIVRKALTKNGKAFSSSIVSYGSAYFEFERCSLDIVGNACDFKTFSR